MVNMPLKDINSLLYCISLKKILSFMDVAYYLLSANKGISTLKVVPRFISV